MHPETLRIYEAAKRRGLKATDWPMRIMAGPHHFHVTLPVHTAAKAIARHEGLQSDDFVFPTSARLPSEKMVLTVDGPGGACICLLLLRDEDGGILCHTATDRAIISEFGFFPGTSDVRRALPEQYDDSVVAAYLAATTDADIAVRAWRLAFILSLINTPRKVQIGPATGMDWTRQHRRAVERVTGSAAMAFSVVSWELGRKCAAIGNEITTEGHPKALHWCRAHWREARKGQPKAEWINLPAKGGWGWYCWVPDCWKGHPDYGVKLQRHQPRMPGEKARHPQAAAQAVLDKTRWEAMSVAHRASVVEAGFAPTTTLH